jgi:CubicO group peptidase (beta-lactamase class C family)
MYNLENGRLVKHVMDVTRPNQKYSAPEFGLFSTTEDLRHLCPMMLNRGTWKGRRVLSAELIEESTRPHMQTTLPKYHSGLGWAVHTRKDAEMSYAAMDGSYGASGASSCLIWIDPSIQLIRIYLTHYFGGGEFADGNPVIALAGPREKMPTCTSGVAGHCRNHLDGWGIFTPGGRFRTRSDSLPF